MLAPSHAGRPEGKRGVGVGAVRFRISSPDSRSGLKSAPQPPPPTFFCKSVIPGQLFLRLYKNVILSDLFLSDSVKQFSPECADSKRVLRLTVRSGRAAPRKLFLRLYKSFILNELLCAAVMGMPSEEVLAAGLERRDSNSVANGWVKAHGLGSEGGTRVRQARGTPRLSDANRLAYSPSTHMVSTGRPMMSHLEQYREAGASGHQALTKPSAFHRLFSCIRRAPGPGCRRLRPIRHGNPGQDQVRGPTSRAWRAQ